MEEAEANRVVTPPKKYKKDTLAFLPPNYEQLEIPEDGKVPQRAERIEFKRSKGNRPLKGMNVQYFAKTANGNEYKGLSAMASLFENVSSKNAQEFIKKLTTKKSVLLKGPGDRLYYWVKT
jgi:hypothetical protein